jgi:hypothetical protein
MSSPEFQRSPFHRLRTKIKDSLEWNLGWHREQLEKEKAAVESVPWAGLQMQMCSYHAGAIAALEAVRSDVFPSGAPAGCPTPAPKQDDAEGSQGGEK